VLGYENATYYTIDQTHPNLGGVSGRHANRIKHSSFEIDGMMYKVAANENKNATYPDGADTLHSGPDGWDWRNFTVVSHSENSITFSIVDPDGKEGFPREVVSYVIYTISGMT
jgi:aldose 1-epimerase